MPAVEIYTKDTCPYCHLAKSILRRHGAHFDEHSLTDDPDLFAPMVERSGGGVTVPQIFIGGVAIGGSDRLAMLEEQGKLAGLLAPAADA
ncbi:glutaredoxin 3 [Erythrobacter sp. NE805]|uniref:glutaredoxin 3 n=1 Tax=Erythrobacter sp. NE805 TaxID=3389875 RepID=UPI00396B0817